MRAGVLLVAVATDTAKSPAPGSLMLPESGVELPEGSGAGDADLTPGGQVNP